MALLIQGFDGRIRAIEPDVDGVIDDGAATVKIDGEHHHQGKIDRHDRVRQPLCHDAEGTYASSSRELDSDVAIQLEVIVPDIEHARLPPFGECRESEADIQRR